MEQHCSSAFRERISSLSLSRLGRFIYVPGKGERRRKTFASQIVRVALGDGNVRLYLLILKTLVAVAAFRLIPVACYGATSLLLSCCALAYPPTTEYVRLCCRNSRYMVDLELLPLYLDLTTTPVVDIKIAGKVVAVKVLS